MLSFRNLPLWAKVLIAPAASLAAGIAVAVSVWLGTTATESRLAAVADRQLPEVAASARLLDAVDKIQAWRCARWSCSRPACLRRRSTRWTGTSRANSARLQTDTAAMLTGRSEADADLPRMKSIAAKAGD